jgi:predicted metal-dependent hydrolase
VTQNLLPVSVPGLEGEFDRVEVRRSARRRKTVSAEIVGNSLVVSVPARMSRAEESEWVRTMARRMAERSRRHRLNSEGALRRRAAQLAAEYLDGVTFAEFTYGGVDKTRWGWCDPKERRIRLSLALAEYPAWVRDYVIVHELAHLLVPDHSERFWALVNRYPLTERARGFLIAKGMEGEGSCG